MSEPQKKDWLQSQFDKAETDQQKEDQLAEKKAKKRQAVRKVVGFVVLVALFGLAAVLYLYREETLETWEHVSSKILPNPDSETRKDRVMSKAAGEINKAAGRANERDVVLDEIYNDSE